MKLKLIELTTKKLFWSIRRLFVIEGGEAIELVSVSKASKYTTVTLTNKKRRKFNNKFGALLYTTVNDPRIEKTKEG